MIPILRCQILVVVKFRLFGNLKNNVCSKETKSPMKMLFMMELPTRSSFFVRLDVEKCNGFENRNTVPIIEDGFCQMSPAWGYYLHNPSGSPPPHRILPPLFYAVIRSGWGPIT
eukprot:GHVO01052621.1.p1 GENE.GHVO01052621.1~~GHVO01052621.1.p1  ORF type:complete len:114 (-),score=13.18 GHVO01052621.1:382-723(-)